MPSPGLRTLVRSVDVAPALLASVKTVPSLRHIPVQRLRTHVDPRMTGSPLLSVGHARRSCSTYNYSYEMLATARELDQMTGFPGKLAKTTSSKKTITDSDGNYGKSDAFTAQSFKKNATKLDTKNDSTNKLETSNSSNSQKTSVQEPFLFRIPAPSSTGLYKPTENAVEKPRSKFGGAKDAEEAAKYYNFM